MRRHQRLILSSVLAVATFGVGWVFSKIFNVPGVQLSKEIDPVGAVSLGITIWIAYLVYAFFDREREIRGREKDILLDRVVDVYSIIENLQEQTEQGEIEFTYATSTLKRIQNRISESSKLIEDSTNLNIPKNASNQIINLIRTLRDSYTNTPINTGSDSDIESEITISNGIVSISDSRKNLIITDLDRLRSEITRYELVINSA